MEMEIEISLRGHPPPRGVKKNQTYGWRMALADASAKYYGKVDFIEGYSVRMVFYIMRPKVHISKDGGIRANAPTLPLSFPDLPPLAAITLEAVARAIGFEKRWCVKLEATKQFVGHRNLQGVDIFGEVICESKNLVL